MAETSGVFRKKSMDRVSSPEQLNDYIKASTPGVWILLLAIIALLIGVCVWGIFGRLDTVVSAGAVCRGGNAVAYVSEKYADHLKSGMTLSIDGKDYTVLTVSENSAAGADIDPYLLHVGGLDSSDWVREVTFSADLADGNYTATIVIDTTDPVSFVIN